MTDARPDEPADRDLYLEQLQERLQPKRWPGLGAVKSAFGVLWQVARLRLTGQVLVQLGLAGLAAVQILLVKLVLQDLVASQQHIVTRVLPLLLGLIAINAATGAITVMQAQSQAIMSELVVRSTWERLLRISSNVPLIAFDKPGFYDRLQRIVANALSKPLLIVQGAIGVAAGLFGMAALFVVVFTVSPVLIPILLVAVVPLYLVARVGGRIDFQFAVAQTPNLRRRVALVDLLIDRAPAAEVRAFGLAGLISRRHGALYDEYAAALRLKGRRRAHLALASGGVTLVVAAAAATVLILLANSGQISLAGAGASAVALALLASRIEQAFSGVSGIMDSAQFVAELDDFEAMAGSAPGGVGPDSDAEPLEFTSIDLEDVRFRYPGSDEFAVSGVSEHIRAGQVIALVGENGSGKTTLSKMLAGLYSPTSGSVKWDGKPIAQLDGGRRARSIAIVFQDFVRYEMSLLENIAVGNPSRLADRDEVRRVVERAGLVNVVAGLRDGLDTFMSPRFPGGADLSVGQWQRVALARALFRDAPLIIMDEPTSALDAKGEAALFELVRDLGEGRTVVLVTHRFATTRSADRILVMDRGEVVESGTHVELMGKQGRYAQLYTLQSAPFTQDSTGSSVASSWTPTDR